MNKRMADVSTTRPRKRAKPDQLYDALNSQTSNANTAAASPSLATSQSREKRKRVIDCTTIDTLDQGTDASHGAKRARTQSPGKMIDYRTIPGFQPWPSVDDDAQSELKYWEDECYTKDLTEEKKLFREYSMMSEMGYYKCTCGKYHHVIGRKSYHYEDGTPEPDSGSELGQTEARTRSVANSAHESRGQDLLPSPGLSDGEADAGDDPREPPPIDVQVHRAYLLLEEGALVAGWGIPIKGCHYISLR